MQDFFENISGSVTICDNTGIVIYQNKIATERDGNAIGKNLFNCHSPKSREKISHMLKTGQSNTYEIIKKGKHHLIQQTPWYKEEGGEVSGLIEFDLDIPDNFPTYNRET